MQPLPVEITAQQLKAALESTSPPHLVDVREPHEFARCRLAGAELIPMRSIPQALAALKAKTASGPVVFYCHHGMRSLQAVSWLRRQGLTGCQSLSGAIDLWSATIDPAVPRY